MAIKFWRFSVRRRGSGGSPVSSSSVKPKTRTFRIAKKGQVAKKNETADDGGGSVSPRPTARYPNPSPRPGPRRQLPNEGVAKNGELLGPKVKAQLALEARGHVCVLGRLPRRERRVSGPHRQLPNEGVAKNGELLGPKVKGQMGYSKANI